MTTIAKPKPNGYQSLHTVVRDAGQAVEDQIRTQAMHDHAEHGVARTGPTRRPGTKGLCRRVRPAEYDAKIAVLRQLLAWGATWRHRQPGSLFDDRIYALTPDAAVVVELPQGATPVDFAYAVHTNLSATAAAVRASTAPWCR